MSRFGFIDLFAGIGGFHIALQELGGQCVFASEIDKNASETYLNNFGIKPHGDIRTITDPEISDSQIEASVPDHDIVAAGFPCQPFSLAGVSARNSLSQLHGLLDDTQGTLFFDIARIVKVKRPRALLLENVSNIVNHDSGRTFEVLRSVIQNDLGYSFDFRVLNSETLVPQRRKRCYMVAFRDHQDARRFEFPSLEGDPLPLRIALEKEVDASFTISDRRWEGHKRRTKNNLSRGTGFTAFEADLDRPSNTLVARYYKDGKECLVPQEGQNPRMLTPRECANLQGFPEWFEPHKTRSAAYKQFGNAVTVPLVKAVAEKILKAMDCVVDDADVEQQEKTQFDVQAAE